MPKTVNEETIELIFNGRLDLLREATDKYRAEVKQLLENETTGESEENDDEDAA